MVEIEAWEVAEKVIFHRLLKNAQIQGASFAKLRINSILRKGEGCRCDE